MILRPVVFLLLLMVFSASAQERLPVEGHVTYKGTDLENVHIQNITSLKYAVSSRTGKFRIGVAAGDTLVFSHVSMNDLIRVVAQKEVSERPFLVELQERDTELSEVIIQENTDINALSLGIITEKLEKPSMNERRLQTAGDFKWYHVFSILGGSLAVDPILNAINGRTKELKRNIETDKKMERIYFLEGKYMAYMEESFKAPEGEIQQFLDHLVELESLTAVLSSGNDEHMKFYLMDEWFKYRSH